MKIHAVTFFRKLVPVFRQPPVALKVVLKVACDPRNFIFLSEQFLELASMLKEGSRNFLFLFSI